MSFDYLMVADSIRAEHTKADGVPDSGKHSVSQRPAIMSFLVRPFAAIREIQDDVKSLGLLVEEASERAEKPWFQRLPED